MASTPDATVNAWEDDPGAPPTLRTPIVRPRPDLARKPLPVGIRESRPPNGPDAVGSAEFRYWTAAEALRRAADYWGGVLPAGKSWHSTVGTALKAQLDDGEDFNAYYDRTGLNFFHGSVAGVTVYSGESPDVVCHELGHAVLDAIRPQLWDVASAEVAAFHESWGDMSAMLSGLQLESMRTRVLAETQSDLSRASSLSRLAEQLGWAIRQLSPQAVDPDCLRNAANRFTYQDPLKLPSSAPASQLCSEPHSFSRVFTGAFLRILAGTFRAQDSADAAALVQTSVDAGRLLVQAALESPVVPGYFSQIAAHMIAADAGLFGGRYGPALRSAFLRHGILSTASATALSGADIAADGRSIAGASKAAEPQLVPIEIDGQPYGLASSVVVVPPAEPVWFDVAAAAPDVGSLETPTGQQVASSFVEDLFRQRRVDVSGADVPGGALTEEPRSPTHELTPDAGALLLVRRLFDHGLFDHV